MDKKYEQITIEDFIGKLKDDTTLEGKLTLTSPYNRSLIYTERQQASVIESILLNAPISQIYFAKYKPGKYWLIDGKQRITSIINFVNDKFTVIFNGVPRTSSEIKSKFPDVYEKFLKYQLEIVLCNSTDSEIENIVIALNRTGENLTKQETKNVIYKSTWLESAKNDFSTTEGCAVKFCNEFGNIFPPALKLDRQDWLEAVIVWKLDGDGIARSEEEICKYMAGHSNCKDASDLTEYFKKLTDWIVSNFQYKPLMQFVNWGPLYNRYKDIKLNYIRTDTIIDELIENAQNDGITKLTGIYEFILSGNPQYLSKREFSVEIKKAKYEEQNHKCKGCGQEFSFDDLHGDHIYPWSKGGMTVADNCQLLCADCDNRKSGRMTQQAKELTENLKIKK